MKKKLTIRNETILVLDSLAAARAGEEPAQPGGGCQPNSSMQRQQLRRL